jgi:hypothetical protein
MKPARHPVQLASRAWLPIKWAITRDNGRKSAQ